VRVIQGIATRLYISVFLILGFSAGFSQSPETANIKNLIESFKKDERGPYQAIRWFCPDGRVLPPDQRCNQPGSIQHALYKDVVQKLAQEQGIYLGQILAGTPNDDFLDSAHQNSRVKQYQLEKYLQATDNGWIIRRARFYRGAIQAEDEEQWGLEFLKKTVAQDEILTGQFFLIRQIVKDLPHNSKDNHWEAIRALATSIADSFPAFMDLRIKLHGLPDEGDVKRLKDFYASNSQKVPPEIDQKLRNLENELELAYQPLNLQSLNDYLRRLPSKSLMTADLNRLLKQYGPESNPSQSQVCTNLAELLWSIRKRLPDEKSLNARVAMLDLSLELESILFRQSSSWKPKTIAELLQKCYVLSKAATGCGFLELWEWETTIGPMMFPPPEQASLTLEDFIEKTHYARRVTEWGSGMVRANFQPVIGLFGTFEPLAYGFTDDRIRSSILLPLGNVAGQLADIAARFSKVSNHVMGIKNQSGLRGLNSGYALGELEVVTGPPEGIGFSDKKIYALQRAPADLKPVAGIATVAEGNLVSHVQLLARNLGIPNAVLSQENLDELTPYSGQSVFYAVSPGGAVVMKPASQMSTEETSLTENRQPEKERITVPVQKLNLQQTELVSLENIRATDSGRLCGPKAANLGQLKSLFPTRVVDGFIIPFGIFRRHMDQPMPDTNLSYWQYLQETFTLAPEEKKRGKSDDEVEAFILERLAVVREAIKNIPFLPEFEKAFYEKFFTEFGKEIGQVPVFIRSDTNMEDLKEFTGAGLNLTVFNVVDKNKVMQAIRDVWASVYTERSYRWRQKYLENAENVFPSILILPTVPVSKSGVMITTGVSSGDPKDVTIAFSRGPGGAVEGQAAESYLLKGNGTDILLSPSREMKYNILPETGGTDKGYAYFNQRIVSPMELQQLRRLSEEIRQKLPGTPGIETEGPFDVELGFKDEHIWLFQVRPYIENKKALSSAYLQNLDARSAKGIPVPMSEKP
jgi:hypothetical protein